MTTSFLIYSLAANMMFGICLVIVFSYISVLCAWKIQLQDCLKTLQEDTLLALEELTMTRELWKSAQKEIEKLEADREI